MVVLVLGSLDMVIEHTDDGGSCSVFGLLFAFDSTTVPSDVYAEAPSFAGGSTALHWGSRYSEGFKVNPACVTDYSMERQSLLVLGSFLL